MSVRVSFGLLWALLLLPAAAPAASGRLDRVVLFGTEYVRLEDWAASHNLQMRWLVPKSEVRLTSRWSTLDFTVDARKMTFNGVSVWLSEPIAYAQGTAHVAATDVTTVLQPVLFPSKNPAGRTIKTICLDAGHGGKDPGNREGRRQEKTYALLLARELSTLLTRAGFKVILTRNSDTFLELPARPELARRRGADLFLSLHFNSADGPGGAAVSGIEVYCMTPARCSSTNARGEGGSTAAYPANRLDAKNMLLAFQVQKALVKNLGAADRGVRRARWAVLRSAEMPAVLIEGGFMSNPAEGRKIADAAYRKRMAEAILEGVMAYKQRVEQ